MKHQLVWFKRDLRVQDHAPLHEACRSGPVTCVYFVEPALWAAPDAATQHYLFIRESLEDLQHALQTLGLTLHVMVGEAIDCLNQIHAHTPIETLYSHEETGNGASFKRDLAVKRWCREQRVVWQEFAQFGVVRGPHNRDHWKEQWEAHVHRPRLAVPTQAQDSGLPLSKGPLPSPTQLGLRSEDPPKRQRGGLVAAHATLTHFLHHRSQQYRGGISSPLSAPTACSRLSAYLSYGCLSLREVVQATDAHLLLRASLETRQRLGLQSFMSRLYWHCHFIQKLEDEPELESHHLHRGYDGLRENQWDQTRFEALKQGRTGWPLVDACVHMLRHTGWLNFRMRAMLVSVAAYPLWLDWRPVGHWLAQQFLDYEPGIHWSQMQMQSGTTGINIPRIYNPIKQAREHDPKGLFVRRWLPGMRKVPDAWLFEPWRMPESLRQHYALSCLELPTPPVELEQALREAKVKLFARRADAQVQAQKSAIVRKHGSRKRLEPARSPRRSSNKRVPKEAVVAASQLSLDF